MSVLSQFVVPAQLMEVSFMATSSVVVDRRDFYEVLGRVQAVVTSRRLWVSLSGVRLGTSGDRLLLAGTDGETTLTTWVEAKGYLPSCVVSCAELVRCIKTSKDDTCTLSMRTHPSRLVVLVRGVEHELSFMLKVDSFSFPKRQGGGTITLDAEEFRTGLAVTSHAVAREPSRYAINGVLLESDADGVRLVATDGQRLVITELRPYETGFQGRVILPSRVARLIKRFVN
ncbi:hypothetical protein LCGC14_2214420, partial [marine sediment metagenome]